MSLKESHTVRTSDAGELKLKKWQLNGIELNHSVVSYTDKYALHAIRDDDVVRMHYGIKGDCSFSHKQLERYYTVKGGQHNIMYSKGFEIEVENHDMYIETFGINIDKHKFIEIIEGADDVLKRFAEDVVNGDAAILSDNWFMMNMGLTHVINDILREGYSGTLKEVFLLSKCIELLELQASAYNRQARMTSIKNRRDKDQIIAARDFLLENIQHPPNLSQIAKAAQTNEYKLKKGFKEMFGTTVFGYLSELRLELARQMLLDTKMQAVEIASELGFATPQHFSNAFKKKFGLTPLSFRV